MEFNLLSGSPKENFPGKNLYKIQKSSLSLPKNALQSFVNREFEVICSVINEETSSYGEVRKTYNSFEYEEQFDFMVNFVEGQAYVTLFELLAQKPEAEALVCKFGYMNRLGKVYIEDNSEIAASYSNQDQFVKTTLPQPDTGNQNLSVFAQCEDVLGRVNTQF